MALIVETGLNITGSDSYISEADAILRAVNLGLPFPATDAEAEIPLRQAATYLEKFRNNYQGTKVFTDQSLQWPRDPVYIDNVLNDKENIPQLLIDAQVSIASAVFGGAKLYGTATGSINSKSVGDVSVSVGNNGALDNSTYFGYSKELLKPLFKNPSLGGLEFAVSRA